MSRDQQMLAVVCRGPDCRGEAQTRLCEALSDAGVCVVTSRCLRICKGPVAMLSIGDRWEVVSRVRTARARRQLVIALRRQRRRGIRERMVGGGRRKRAIARSALALARHR